MRLTGTVFRAHHPCWAFRPVSGARAAHHGGRFNPKGIPALYASRRLETAWLEAQQAFPFKAQPMTICAYAVDCDAVLDLTDPSVRARHAVAETDLARAWEGLARRRVDPPSWILARRLFEAGMAGIMVPSFTAGAGRADVNAVFWRWADEPPHQVRVVDDAARLPADDRSWTG